MRSLLVLASLAAAAVFAGEACAANDGDLAKRAADAADAGQYSRAAYLYRLAAAEAPRDRTLPRNAAEMTERAADEAKSETARARAAAAKGDESAARKAYIDALMLDPSDGAAREALRKIEGETVLQKIAAFNARLHHQAEAAKAADDDDAPDPAPKLDKAGLDAMLSEADGALARGDADALATALDHYGAAAARSGVSSKTIAREFFRRADTLRAKKQEEAALQVMQAGLAYDAPASKTAATKSLRERIAGAYYEQGVMVQRSDIDKAIVLYRKALAVDPDHAGAREKLDQAKLLRDRLRALR